jgi:pimeloyl-ACP methyl ester carboxylesterase
MAAPPTSMPVHVSTYGRAVIRGAKTVFLIHGAGMDQSVWTLQGRYLAFHGWNALAIDLPGHGRSRPAAPLASIEEMADWLALVIAQTSDAPVALIGHSMGALVGLDLAARYPGRVGRLCLLGAAARMPVHQHLLEVAARHDPKAVELISDWAFGPRGHIGGNPLPGGWMMGNARGLLLRTEPAVLHADLAACNAYAAGADRAAAVGCPTLVVIGGEDRMTPPRAGQQLASLLVDARVVTIGRAGHMSMLEAPEETLDAISAFLA